jgi:hypothetical protein
MPPVTVKRPKAVTNVPGGEVDETEYNYALEYARENPGMAALWCFGIGFILGWKLKPW